MTTRPLSIFAPGSTRELGARVAQHVGVALAPLEERDFEDGEHKIRPLACVRDHDAYVIHSLYGEPAASANDKLIRLLFLIGALRDTGAERVTAVTPYLCYARKDARTQPRDPISSRYVAQLVEALGANRVMALEVHNPAAYANALRIQAEHLSTATVFAQALSARLGRDAPVAVVSPDPGGFKRAERLRAALSLRMSGEVSLALVEKRRAHGRAGGDPYLLALSGRRVRLQRQETRRSRLSRFQHARIAPVLLRRGTADQPAFGSGTISGHGCNMRNLGSAARRRCGRRHRVRMAFPERLPRSDR